MTEDRIKDRDAFCKHDGDVMQARACALDEALKRRRMGPIVCRESHSSHDFIVLDAHGSNVSGFLNFRSVGASLGELGSYPLLACSLQISGWCLASFIARSVASKGRQLCILSIGLIQRGASTVHAT